MIYDFGIKQYVWKKDYQVYGWKAIGNTCPNYSSADPQIPRNAGNPAPAPLTGSCAEASCDASRFFYQSTLTWLGMKPIIHGIYMPNNSEEMEGMLSDSYKEMYSKYNLPSRAFDYPYRYVSKSPAQDIAVKMMVGTIGILGFISLV
jgi:hypothetical protein